MLHFHICFAAAREVLFFTAQEEREAIRVEEERRRYVRMILHYTLHLLKSLSLLVLFYLVLQQCMGVHKYNPGEEPMGVRRCIKLCTDDCTHCTDNEYSRKCFSYSPVFLTGQCSCFVTADYVAMGSLFIVVMMLSTGLCNFSHQWVHLYQTLKAKNE